MSRKKESLQNRDTTWHPSNLPQKFPKLLSTGRRWFLLWNFIRLLRSQLDNGACLAGRRLSGPIMRIIGNYPQLRLVLFVLCLVQQTISAGLRPYKSPHLIRGSSLHPGSRLWCPYNITNFLKDWMERAVAWKGKEDMLRPFSVSGLGYWQAVNRLR